MEEPLNILVGDCRETLKTLPAASVHCCVTSPPYWGLRDYGHDGQIGLEETPEAYVAKMVEVFLEVRRVLREDGTCWINLGDSYAAGKAGRTDDGCNDPTSTLGPKPQGLPNNSGAGSVVLRKPPPGLKPKDLVGIPWRVAFALQADGWYLRQDIIWHKPNPMPESVTDRCCKSHEYLFLLTKSARYYFDNEAIKEPSVEPVRAREKNNGESAVDTKMRGHDCNCGNTGMRTKRSVWTITTKPFSGAHFATFPPDLIKPCIMAGTKPGDVVLDPFAGSGTTGMVALDLGRRAILCELNPEYVEIIRQRTNVTLGLGI